MNQLPFWLSSLLQSELHVDPMVHATNLQKSKSLSFVRSLHRREKKNIAQLPGSGGGVIVSPDGRRTTPGFIAVHRGKLTAEVCGIGGATSSSTVGSLLGADLRLGLLDTREA